jgi:hypothetical protein
MYDHFERYILTNLCVVERIDITAIVVTAVVVVVVVTAVVVELDYFIFTFH